MDSTIVVAYITSITSLIVAGGTAVWSGRNQQRLTRQQAAALTELEQLRNSHAQLVRTEDRALTARTHLDRYREPLLNAANELGDRIDNIRNGGVMTFVDAGGHRGEAVVMSTLFRFAHYLARLELLFTDMSALRFERDADTKAVAELIAAIGQTMATDRFPGFMLWRDEQRAIGELMCRDAGESRKACLGYSDFVQQYDERFKSWMGDFVADLRAPDVHRNSRLKALQDLLSQLVRKLDEEKVLVRVGEDLRVASPGWIARSV